VATGGERPTRRLSGERRREQLLEVALSLFAERGFPDTTMDDIAEAAGVTKPLLYQHFSSKRALYLELADSVAADLVAAISSATSSADGPRRQVETGFAAYFELVLTRESAFRLLFGRAATADEELGEALRTVEDAIAKAIDPLIDAGLDDDHRRLLAYAVIGMAEGAMRNWVAVNGRASIGTTDDGGAPLAETRDGRPANVVDDAARLARRIADLAWAGLRSVHPD
jgi:AcrR family transcriptional regulator